MILGHASMCDVEALYDDDLGANPSDDNQDTEEEPEQLDTWFSNGCWPPKIQEQVVLLIDSSFAIGTIEKCHGEEADVNLMTPINVRGHNKLSHWVVDGEKKITAPKASILPIRPVLDMKGRKKSLKFYLVNLELIQEFIGALHAN